MLGTVHTFADEPVVNAGPSATWYQGRLWLSYVGVSGTLVVRSSAVTGDVTDGVRTDTGLSCQVSAIASTSTQLVVAFCDPAGRMFLTSSKTGKSFKPPIELPFPDGFIGGGSMVSTPAGLAMAWGENAGGIAHLAVGGGAAGGFTDHQLPFRVACPMSITVNSDSTALTLASVDREGGAQSLFVTSANFANAAVTPERITAGDIEFQNVTMCLTGYHGRAGIHVAAQSRSTWTYSAFSRAAPAQGLGEVEFVALPADELALAWDGAHAWVGLRSASGLQVAPYAAAFMLPEGLKQLLGQDCDPAVCPPDPRIVCAAAPEETRWDFAPAQIANAYKGDLIVTPSDGAGPIGQLLNALKPRQWLDHNAILIRDHDMVRHCTMAHKRLEGESKAQPSHMMTGSLFGEPAPTDGFMPHAMRYGWPGTLTQTVEDAIFTGLNTMDATDSSGAPYNRQGDYYSHTGKARPVPAAAELFSDPEYPDDRYRIANLVDRPAYSLISGEVLYPRVVKPPPPVEAANPEIRKVLHQIADVSTTIDGHYRFYSYTDASIATKPEFLGPPKESPVWALLRSGADWCADTHPLVCSSFIWLAVITAVQQGLIDPVVLEGAAELDETPDPGHDGLYLYSQGSRAGAAEKLYEYTYGTVQQIVQEALLQLDDDTIALAIAKYSIAELVNVIFGAAEAAAALLGLSTTNIANLILAFSDMPDDVATQMCNTFAFDHAEDTDDDGWKTPGAGVAVSPDNMARNWDAASGAIERVWAGLWGYSDERALVTPRRPEIVIPHRYAPSSGPALVRGTVYYRGAPVDNVRVQAGCETTMSGSRDRDTGHYEFDIAAGRYTVTASTYWPDSDQLLRGTRDVDLSPGQTLDAIDIELQDPPEWRRLIEIVGRADVVRHVYVGDDDWAHTPFSDLKHLSYVPNGWGGIPENAPPEARTTTATTVFSSHHAQRFNVITKLDLRLFEPSKGDLSVAVEATSWFCENVFGKLDGSPPKDKQLTARPNTVTIEPGASAKLTFDHNSGNAPPDRAHVELTITNRTEPA